jgi:hypothetical protein
MERTIRLLREKNHYLEQFFVLNQRELARFEAGDFNGIESFYRQRGEILDILRSLDEMLDVENHGSVGRACGAEDRASIEGALDAKKSWVAEILAQDLRLLSRIDDEKSKIIRELQATGKARKAIGAYGGAGASGRLHEKA